MEKPLTLLQLAGGTPTATPLASGILVLIDFQNEYLNGPLGLPDASEAVANAARLVRAARMCGTPVVHVVHAGGDGGLFDRNGHRGAIVSALAPVREERVVWKTRPNAFHLTALEAVVRASGRSMVIAGLMTHMCVSSTCRAALDLGLPVTLVHDACATRPLLSTDGAVIPAGLIHAAEVAALADRFVALAGTADML